MAIGLTLAFSRDVCSILASLMIYVAFGYSLIIRDMLFEYLGLVSKHTNTKEKAARLKTTKEKCLDKDSDFKLQEVPTKLKCKRFFNFCIKKKNPKSQITAADSNPQKFTVVYETVSSKREKKQKSKDIEDTI